MDPIDQAIIIFLSEDPDLTMKEIAEQVNLTQPSIGSRVRSLREQGFLQKIYGINFEVANLQIVRVDIQTKDINELIDKIALKTNILNIFTLTGEYNLSIYFFGKNLAETNQFIDKHIRNNSVIAKIKVNIINKIISNPVLPSMFNNNNNNNNKHSLKKTDKDLKNNGHYPLPKIQALILALLKEHHEVHPNRLLSNIQELIDFGLTDYKYRLSHAKIKTHIECLNELGLVEYIQCGSTKFVRLKN